MHDPGCESQVHLLLPDARQVLDLLGEISMENRQELEAAVKEEEDKKSKAEAATAVVKKL